MEISKSELLNYKLPSIEGLNKNKMLEIYDSLNQYMWHEILGAVPPNWNEIPDMHNNPQDKKFLCKSDYVGLIMEKLERHFSYEEFLRYANVEKGKMTNEEFTKWWKEWCETQKYLRDKRIKRGNIIQSLALALSLVAMALSLIVTMIK